MCHHSWEPTVLSRGSLNIDRFHQPCLLPWRTPTAAVKTAAVRAGIGGGCHLPYHVATTYPCWQPGFPSVRLTGGTYHADWTVPLHRLLLACLGDPDPLGHQNDEEFHLHCEEWFSNWVSPVAHGSPSILASWFDLQNSRPTPRQEDAKFFECSKIFGCCPSRAGSRSKTFPEIPIVFRSRIAARHSSRTRNCQVRTGNVGRSRAARSVRIMKFSRIRQGIHFFL